MFSNDDLLSTFFVLACLVGVIGWGVIEFVLWVLGHVSVVWS